MTIASADPVELARSWITLHHLPQHSSERERVFWAYVGLSDLIHSHPEEAWKTMETIRALDGSDLILSNLAAGPFEDLLVSHGDDFIERIEALAESDAQFRKLLGATWQNEIPDELWARIKAAASPPW